MSNEELDFAASQLAEALMKYRELGKYEIFLQEENFEWILGAALALEPQTSAESLLKEMVLIFAATISNILLGGKDTEFTMLEIIKANPKKEWNIAITTLV